MLCELSNCDTEVIGRSDKRFCSDVCRNRAKVTRHRKRLKQRAVDYKGGKCQRCGYDKCVAALTSSS